VPLAELVPLAAELPVAGAPAAALGAAFAPVRDAPAGMLVPLDVAPPPPRAVSVDSARTTGCPRLSTGHEGVEVRVVVFAAVCLALEARAVPPAAVVTTRATAVRAMASRAIPLLP
jgi:hypothetical protein